MITPRFSLSQDDKTVSITIRAPYCSLKELDVNVEEKVFIFSCRPYYLRIHLPGEIEENDNTHSVFDADSGEFTFTYEKVNYGEHFPDLEFITKFLGAKVEIESGDRKIELLGSVEATSTTNADEEIQYGFAMRGGYKFNIVNGEFRDIFDIDPYEVKFELRQQIRQDMEKKQFDPEYYLADLFDNDEIPELLKMNSPREAIDKDKIQFTSAELDFLKDLTNVDYNLSPQQIKYCHTSLIELLFAYCYDYRSTCFESTCESGWTISKLSSSLCCFDSFSSVKKAVTCAFRRSLIYPLYRNFNLCQKILNDLKFIINLGEQCIIKCLIEMHNIFLRGDSGRYILNNLFIKHYIIYIMKWDRDVWGETVKELKNVVIEKQDLGLNLLKLEQSAVLEEDLSSNLAGLSINEESDSDDYLSGSESCSSSDTESSDG